MEGRTFLPAFMAERMLEEDNSIRSNDQFDFGTFQLKREFHLRLPVRIDIQLVTPLKSIAIFPFMEGKRLSLPINRAKSFQVFSSLNGLELCWCNLV